MPEQWDGASIEKQFRGSVYTITYKHTGAKKLIVNGNPIEGYIVPVAKCGEQISVVCEF
jgi:cellobiose phosphorylase